MLCWPGAVMLRVHPQKALFRHGERVLGTHNPAGRLTCGDRSPGMIATVPLRLLYLIFSLFRGRLTLLSHA
jgi:hypothetical protein